MRWPWTRRETRSSTYTEALIAAQVASANAESAARVEATAALETCAGFVSRAFAAAEVKAPETVKAALDPYCLALIGRALIRRGDLVFLIDVKEGRLTLLPASSCDVYGEPDPATWRYEVTLAGPDKQLTVHKARGDGVVHLRYAFDADAPWRGFGPLQVAKLAGRLSAETVAALADEASGPRGSFLPLPVDGADPTISTMKSDIRKAKGQALAVEAGDWNTADPTKSTTWRQMRFGAAPPEALVALQGRASREVMAACGLNPAVFDIEGDGTAMREGYRQALHSLVAPLGRLVAHEMSAKLEAEVALDWAELRAGDIAGRARAFQSMVGAGMDAAKAAALAGLMVDDG